MSAEISVIDQLSFNDTTTTTASIKAPVVSITTMPSSSARTSLSSPSTSLSSSSSVHHVAIAPKPSLFERVMGDTVSHKKESLQITNPDEFQRRKEEYQEELSKELSHLPAQSPSTPFGRRASLDLQPRVHTSLELQENLSADDVTKRGSLDHSTVLNIHDPTAKSSRSFRQLKPEEKKQVCIQAAKLSLEKYMGEGWLDTDKQNNTSSKVHVEWSASQGWFTNFITVHCHVTAFESHYDESKTFVDIVYNMHMDNNTGEMKTYEMVYKEMECETYFEGNGNK